MPLAKLSGASAASMVSQIEAGREASPTIATLWNSTRALQVISRAFLDGGLRACADRDVAQCRRSDHQQSRHQVVVSILSRQRRQGRHEVYELLIAAGGKAGQQSARALVPPRTSDVLEGTLDITSAEADSRLKVQAIRRAILPMFPHAITAVDALCVLFWVRSKRVRKNPGISEIL